VCESAYSERFKPANIDWWPPSVTVGSAIGAGLSPFGGVALEGGAADPDRVAETGAASGLEFDDVVEQVAEGRHRLVVEFAGIDVDVGDRLRPGDLFQGDV